MWCLALTFYFIGLLTDAQFLCIDKLGYYFVFTLIGMQAVKHKASIDKGLSNWYVIIIVGALFWGFFLRRNSDFLAIRELSRFVTAISGTSIVYP